MKKYSVATLIFAFVGHAHCVRKKVASSSGSNLRKAPALGSAGAEGWMIWTLE